MFRANYKINQQSIEEMSLSITFTMPVKNWRVVAEKIRSAPNWYVYLSYIGDAILNAITDLTNATNKDYTYPPNETKE